LESFKDVLDWVISMLPIIGICLASVISILKILVPSTAKSLINLQEILKKVDEILEEIILQFPKNEILEKFDIILDKVIEILEQNGIKINSTARSLIEDKVFYRVVDYAIKK
jgi:predicted PurR-regulated permease PerM